MNNDKDVSRLIENFIQEEREISINPFISTRIMEAIREKGIREVNQALPAWKAALVAFCLVVAVFTGIAVGNLYQPPIATNEVVLMNDNRMEHFEFYSQLDNE
jgi:quinol-cytochrome oxidoreductase complex cytochrome b subunit